jgi:hypothetical protein
MYARITTFEGGTDIDGAVADMMSADGPPPGVPATELYVFADRAAGKVITVSFFETEDDLQTGHATLNSMSPDAPRFGTRTGVDLVEVVKHMKA